MVESCNLQNFHLLTLSLPTEEVFQVNGQNRLVANLPVVDFHSQPREMLTPKPPNTWLSVFLWVYWFSSPSIRVWTSLSVSDAVFFSVLAAIIRESSDKQLVLRIVKALPFIHQPDRGAPKASDVSAADWQYQHTWKNTTFFHVCCYGFPQGRKSLYNTAGYVIKRVNMQSYNPGVLGWGFLRLLLRLQLGSLSAGVPSSHLEKDGRLILGHVCIYSWKRHALYCAVLGYTKNRRLNAL